MRNLAAVAITTLAVTSWLPACTDDPQDPKTWIKKLDDPREQKEAVRQLVKLKDEQGFDGLAALFKKSKEPEVLKAIGSLKLDKNLDKAVDLFREQLDFSEDTYEPAAAAATALAELARADDKGQQAAQKAVDELIKAATKKTNVRSRSNIVRIEAMKALVATKDPKAVPALAQVLEVSADEQDFMLNRDAARHLAEYGDARAVPVLIRGLFMTGRGTDIFQICRYALTRVGAPAVEPLIDAMRHKNKELEADAKKYQFFPGAVVHKTAYVLGDLRDKRAVPALLEVLRNKDEGLKDGGLSEHQEVLFALGKIGDPSTEKPLAALIADGKRPVRHRTAAATALALMGATGSMPVLLAAARVPYFSAKDKSIDTEKAGLVVELVTQYSRLADSDVSAALAPLAKAAPPGTDVEAGFKNALARVAVAKECGKGVECYGKALQSPESPRSEKAAFMLGRLGHDAVKPLQRAVAHKDSATRFAALASLTQVATKADKEVLKALEDQIELERTKPPMQPLVDEMRVTAASIARK